MDFKKLVLLIGALVIAAVTAVTAKNMFSGASAPVAEAKPAVPAGPEILVATRPLPVGTIVDAEALRYQMWPEGLVQPSYFKKDDPATGDVSALIGSVVRNEISAGQPVVLGSLIKPGERGFMAAALGPGMRAITVGVSTTSSVAGFVFPGDRVDIMLTHEVGGGEGPALKVVETVFQNVRVLATEHRLSATNEEGKASVSNYDNVTLEVTPKLAEKIQVAQTIGSLSLVLRPIADNMVELERAIAAGDVQVPEGTDPTAEKRMLLSIAGKPTDTTSTFTVGAEVSRYQRKTVPTSKNPNADEVIGPAVRVARGTNVTIVPLGAK
jgi:pilus assembly protein CpaB